jgi:TolA-binding protein
MISFKKYYKLRENEGTEDSNFLSSTQSVEAETSLLKELIRMAWNRYQPEVQDFFNQLANKDPEMKEKLNKLIRSPEELSHADRLAMDEKKKRNLEIIAPPLADSGGGEEDEY